MLKPNYFKFRPLVKLFTLVIISNLLQFIHFQNSKRDCQIKDQGLLSLISQISRCTNLSTLMLQLRDNQLFFKDSLGFERLMNLKNLKMDLRGNLIYQKGIITLGSCLEKCKNLKNLFIDLSSGNNLSTVSINDSVPIVSNLKLIQSLTLKPWYKKYEKSDINYLIHQLNELRKLNYLNLTIDFSAPVIKDMKQQFYNKLKRQNIKLVQILNV
ncbi:hypothetical protein TTHERM_001075759 (macronuclear) [Tetrahymena thermophila SB210]|uniref:Uncharacterized protein n=1 Tax=Tetrahymena thermophila (strain SB210) TaxID=312017 RepID=W7X6V5_TETTS|nr:hypothetical protein TTHERM_001075759 [Tetrahymena thermophila SB210]EWS72118.1 hypothetical protein TTHERM_001075759 [Tetrahymena thermophila SB210]|eukprot:XP_012655352.1 hypothetical protein TTHERM_001075759 [Tetrahymena thermophila SB210]